MNYHLMGPAKNCDWHLSTEQCREDATVLFVMRMSRSGEPIFRFYCSQHAEEQRRLEEGS